VTTVPRPGFALAAIKALSHVAPRLPVLNLKNEDFTRAIPPRSRR
jgi:hypothetical protein